MAILVDTDTRLVVQGLTGSEGVFTGSEPLARDGRRCRSHPRQGAAGRRGIPVFDTVADAVSETGANTAMVFVPAPFAADAMYEAIDAGIDRHLHHRGRSRPRAAADPRVHPES